MSILDDVKNLNEKYKLNNSNGVENNESTNYTFIKGNIPILLSAPHAVKQLRNGEIKSEDANTGGIVEYLCYNCKCYGIIRNFNKLDDPNNDNFGLGLKYKQRIIKAIRENSIKFVLDIHGCNDSHNFDFCIGTNNRKNLNGQNQILDILSIGLNSIGTTAIDECFKASLNNNISRYIASNTSIPCIQLEISNRFRTDSSCIEQLLLALQTCVYNINERCLNKTKVKEKEQR